MAPGVHLASPNGDGLTIKDAMAGYKVASIFKQASASSGSRGSRKGVSIQIDTTSPTHDDLETTFLPQSCTASPAAQQGPTGKAAWGLQESGSRPGSRQSLGPHNSKFSMGSAASSRAHSTSGRFSQEELLCFKRVPTPGPSCDNKSENYFDPGGPGTLRKQLTNDNWNRLPVMKGKFYSHPKLGEAVNHLRSEKAGAQNTRQKRQNQLCQRPQDLPDEALTASLLDEIYPRTAIALQKEREGIFFDTGDDPLTPMGDGSRKKSRMAVNKRLSAVDLRSQDALKLDVGIFETHASSSVTSANISPTHLNTTQQANALGAAFPTPGGRDRTETAASSVPAARVRTETEAQRREIMLEFRRQMFEKFNTIKEGFDLFEKEFPKSHEMTKKEWRRTVSKLGFVATVEERDAIFQQLDVNGNGHVSMMEFHIAIEAAAPVRSMEDLRRRWLASNYQCMSHAFNIMEEGSPNKRLTLREFGEVLSRVHVPDPAEHISMFNAIADQTCPTTCKVSIGELASALATVSPAAHMEEIRYRLLKRYNGVVEKAFWDIDLDHSGVVSLGEFKARAIFRIGLTEAEAVSFFDSLDCSGDGSITINEFLCSMSMSEPSLFYEDLRKKIRQRFRSIREAFAIASEDFANADLQQNPKLQFHRYEILLQDMEWGPLANELRTLFELIDANREGALTMGDFLQGMYHFAPSCVLEDLRLTVLQRYEFIWQAFVDIGVDRNAPLDFDAFTKMLDKQGLSGGLEMQKIFALLDARGEGVVTLGKLIAALQAGGPGNHQRPPSAERERRATSDVRAHMTHHHKFAVEVKNQVRQGLHTPEEKQRQASGGSPTHGDSPQEVESPSAGCSPAHRTLAPRKRLQHSRSDGAMLTMQASMSLHGATPKGGATPTAGGTKAPPTPKSASGSSQKQDAPKAPTGAGDAAAAAAEEMDEVLNPGAGVGVPRLRVQPQEELAKYMAKLDPSRIQEHKKFRQEDPVAGAQHSWHRLFQCVHNTNDPKERYTIERELLQYYQKASKSVSHDVPLLERSHSRHAIHRSVRAHSRALAQNRVPKSAPT